MTQDANAEAVAGLADQLALASSAILEFRISNKKRLKPEQRSELEDVETALDQLVAILRGTATRLLAKDAAEPLAQLKAAIDHAASTIAKIKRIKAGLAIAAALVNVAASLVGGDVKGLISAAKALKKVTDDADKELHPDQDAAKAVAIA